MDKILMTIVGVDGTRSGTVLPASVFQQGHGVRTLLELDPDSVIEVHKPESGMSIRYEIAGENL